MNISQRQFDQLTEMGINLWQRKANILLTNSANKNDTKQEAPYVLCNNEKLAALSTQKIFTDILLSLGLYIGEVKVKSDHLDLGLFNWYFSAESQKDATIYCLDNNLVSPTINKISQSSLLKKQLWHTITSHLL